MGIYIVLIPSDGDDLMGPEIKTKKKNASIMENVLPPSPLTDWGRVSHKSQVVGCN